MRINPETLYLERTTIGSKRKITSKAYEKKKWRDWFLVKYGTSGAYVTAICTGIITIPKKYAGKRVRLKLEIIKEEE